LREVRAERITCMKSAGLAAVLSFFISGLGQIYNGQILKGLVIIVVQVINGALTTILIGWIPLAIVWVWAIIDAYREAERINARRGLR
jgi:TM2 domain-containing membrane protein YozV